MTAHRYLVIGAGAAGLATFDTLAEYFAAIEPAESRIDIIRKIWLKQVALANTSLDEMERRLPPIGAAAAQAASTPETETVNA